MPEGPEGRGGKWGAGREGGGGRGGVDVLYSTVRSKNTGNKVIEACIIPRGSGGDSVG